MSTVLTILAFLFIFSLLIVIHEFGHFYAAKRSGVKVEEFGFGLPPRIWGFKKGETFYSLNAIPFGGFVRTLGEGDSSAEGRLSKRSFSNQTLGVQAFIVCAGVIMNLLLSFVLLTSGFLIGMEPLIATEEDFNNGIREGYVHVEPGIVVLESNQPYNTVYYNGGDLEVRSFEPGDRLLGFDTMQEWEAVLEHSDTMISMQRANGSGGGEFLTPELYEQTVFAPILVPRLVYQGKEATVFGDFLRAGDVLVRVNGRPVLTESDLFETLKMAPDLAAVEWTFYRADEGVFGFTSGVYDQNPLLTFVEEGSPAAKAGLQTGDEIVELNGMPVQTAVQVSETIQSLPSDEVVSLLVSREGETILLDLNLDPETGRMGVGLADPVPYYGFFGLYPSYSLSTLMGIDAQRYSLWEAPQVAFSEMLRLGKMTALTFITVLKQFVVEQSVPAGVSGPVGIAQMTGVTLEQGFSAMLRFVAMLSLSLGVINILPFPALDGGHFAVIVFKALSGKKPHPRVEQLIHSIGFIFLLLLIGFITLHDIANLFS